MVDISTMPLEITNEAAILAAYGEEIDRIIERLSRGFSVMVECDKSLTMDIYVVIRARLRRTPALGLALTLCSGHSALQAEMPMTLMQGILNELKTCVFNGGGDESKILVIPHLDVLTTTTRSGLNLEAREAIVTMFENPRIRFLGFKDPQFEIPEVLENAFSERISMIGLKRSALPSLVTQREARKFCVRDFNPFALFKYVSGLNAIRFRQIMKVCEGRMDFDPANPGTGDAILQDIRRMTTTADVDVPNVSLEDDIGGYASVKKQIREDILDLLAYKDGLTNAAEIKRIEEIVPKGMVFLGPPGTGKTFFAKAMATALNATVIIVSGPELKSKWVGDSEANLRNVFAQARASAPSIIVFDEIDSFATARGTYTGSGVEHSMVNQLLTEMDGFRKEEQVFIVGTTNFAESLDPALLRPGRFELQIEIPYPDAVSRRAICEIYKKKFELELADDVMEQLVELTGHHVDDKRTVRYSGDHIYAIFRRMLRDGMRRKTRLMTLEDVHRAMDKKASKARKPLTKEEEGVVAYHECGHAFVSHRLGTQTRVNKISIASDMEDALGYVERVLKDSGYIQHRKNLIAEISTMLAGRAAEEIFIGEVSGGASDDLQKATRLVRAMIEELGMGHSLGNRVVAGRQGYGENAYRDNISQALAKEIDDEISQVLDECYTLAKTTIEGEREAFEKLVASLLEKKVLNGDDLIALIGE